MTSYDYDAPLTEDGQITEKYRLFKEVVSKYRRFEEIPLTTKIRRKAYGEIPCSGKTDLFSAIGKMAEPVYSPFPLSMEDMGQSYGYILYRLKIRDGESVDSIRLENAADRVICCHDGQYVYTAFAENMQEEFKPREKRSGGRIDLLCENIGRENFGTGLENQRKGILGGVKINDHRHFGYEIFPLPLDEEQLEKIDFSGEYSAGVPGFYQFEFEVQKPGDTFLDTAGFGKGCAFINGFNLGRFWEIGPQRRLYIPAPLLREGRNTLILFETEGKAGDHIVPIQVHHIFLKSRRSESISVWYVRHPAKLCWQLSRCRVSYKYKKVYHPAEASQNQTILLYSPYFSLSSDNA